MLFGDQKDLKSNISSLLLWIHIHTDISLCYILTITSWNDRDPNIDTGTYPQHDILCSLKLVFIIITGLAFTVIMNAVVVVMPSRHEDISTAVGNSWTDWTRFLELIHTLHTKSRVHDCCTDLYGLSFKSVALVITSNPLKPAGGLSIASPACFLMHGANKTRADS